VSALLLVLTVIAGCSGTGQRASTPASSPTSSPTGSTVLPTPARPVVYSSRYDAIYLDAEKVTTPDDAETRAAIDRGLSPVITLGYKFGPFTRAQIAIWGPAVQAYFRTFVDGLRSLSDYAAARDNGTRVYFADEHEAVVKINQGKYDFAGYGSERVPTIHASAQAWNKVMTYVAKNAPDVVRVYWYGGAAGSEEDAFAADLDADLIQMATFDPYRWRYNDPDDTAEQLWGDRILHLKSQPWMKDRTGHLKPWGLTEWGTDVAHGDASNARFVTETVAYLKSQGAAFAIYFDRRDRAGSHYDFVISDGRQPRTLRAYERTLTQATR
jgi:hypothetical protein